MNKLNLTELKALAKEEGLKGYSTMTKPALVSHLSGGAMLGGSSKFESLNVDQLRGYIKGKTGVSVAKVKKEELVQMAKGEKDVPSKPKRTGNIWIQAVKAYNEQAKPANYTVPKDGTAEYQAVIDQASKILGRKYVPKKKQGKQVVEPVKVKKTRKAKKDTADVMYV